MTIARSIILFVLAALAEIGGAWLVRQGWREHRGLTLEEAVKQVGPLPEESVLHLAATLARALIDIHRVDLVHRDSNPPTSCSPMTDRKSSISASHGR